MMEPDVFGRLAAGCVIPAHPLALTSGGKLDERHQRALTRYYLAAGAGGLAVGVHTTQFAIHDPQIGLYEPVLQLAAETARAVASTGQSTPPVMIAGLVGDTRQATREAALAAEMGYHLGLLSLAALKGRSIEGLVDHARQVAEVIPIMGFYLQPALSHVVLPGEFWSRFVEIPNVRAIKIAPFDRYQTLDVLEAVAHSGRRDDIALYTGNDDHIVMDLLSRHEFPTAHGTVSLRIVGGLLGQWACWTKRAVETLETIRHLHETAEPISPQLLVMANQLTLANKAIFDADHGFAGCIPGISYVLRRQGLMTTTQALAPSDRLSPGQTDAIDHIRHSYPHLTDDAFVEANLSTWLSP